MGLLPCDSIEFLSNCGGGLGVPLELRQVTWGSFRVVEGPHLELRGAAAAIIRLAPLYLLYAVGYCIVTSCGCTLVAMGFSDVFVSVSQ